jgi:hypothetical protein
MESIVRKLSPVFACLFAAAVAYAQGTGPTETTLDAYPSIPAASPTAGAPTTDNLADSSSFAAPVEHVASSTAKPQSWWWVHAGVAFQVAGNLADMATSWKQPEGNSWLAQSNGPFVGKFYTSGAAKKSLLAGCIVSASYAIAYKWPKARRLVGVFNMILGAGFTAAAVNNLAQNPNFK